MFLQQKRLSDRLYKIIVNILSSDKFFYAVLLLATLQGVWYALSFVPSLFDEAKHLGRIYVYAEHLHPFLGEQKPEWDKHGVVSRDASYLFYYIMSLPLRFMKLFTQDTMLHTLGLRLICLGFFIGALAVYKKALMAAGNIPRSVVNLAFLFFVMTPLVAPLPGAVNYDSLVLLIFAFVLLLSVKVVNSKKVSFSRLAVILIIGLLMCVVKWTSIALFIPIVAYLSFDLFRRYKTKTLSHLLRSAQQLPKLRLFMIVLGMVIAVGLFIERPIMNTIEYGNPEAGCIKVIGHERCMQHHDYRIYWQVGLNRPDDFLPINPVEYLLTFWMPRMINTQVSLLPWSAVKLSPALPVMQNLYFSFALVSVVLILVYLRELSRLKSRQFLLFVTILYSILLLLFLYRAYKVHAIPAAISARYLVPILPIFLSFTAISFIKLFAGHKKALLAVLVVVLLLFTQGGGMITHSLTAKNRLYIESDTVREVNTTIQNFLRPLVIEGNHEYESERGE